MICLDGKAALIKGTTFLPGKGMEFLLALLNIAALDRISVSKKAGGIDPLEEEPYAIITDIKSRLSDYLCAELAHFFGSVNASIPHFSFVLESLPYWATAEDMIHGFKEYPALSLLQEARIVWKQLTDHRGTVEDARAWLVEDRLAHETKHRLLYLLETLYSEYYAPYEQRIYEIIVQATTRLNAVFLDDPESFYSRYLSIQPDAFVGRASIHVSAFLRSSLLILQPQKADAASWIAIGANIVETKRAVSVEAKKTALKFFKLMSDRTRFEIVLLLSGRPWYNEELANHLGISPATANYHLASMLELDIVKMVRDQHRMYYSLEEDKLRQLLHHIQCHLLGEHKDKTGG